MCIQFKKYDNLNPRPQISFCNISIKHIYVDWIIISHIASSTVRENNKLILLY